MDEELLSEAKETKLELPNDIIGFFFKWRSQL